MTKDRRLGRGLAALLGTPLDEGQIIESTATAAAPGDANPTIGAGQSPKPRLVTTERSSIHSPSSNATENESDRGIASKGAGVTGAVSLASIGADSSSSGSRTLELRVDEIENNPFQPRREFNEDEIASLAESLKEHQQLQPVLVRKVAGRYQLISGERRLRAAAYAGLKTIRAEVREADDRLVAELAIVENLQRKDLNPIEKAMSFKRYLEQHACKQEDLARRLKIDRSTIANLMRLLELPSEILAHVQSDKVSAGHARALLPLGDEQQQLEFAQKILTDGWSVRETERQVARQIAAEDDEDLPQLDTTPASRKRTTSPQTASLEQEMRISLGTKIEIRHSSRGRGKIVVHFSNSEEFERLRQLMVPNLRKSAA